MKPQIIVAILTLSVASCMSAGTKVDDAQVASLQRGKTTLADVQAHFGTPTTRTVTSDGQTVLAYSFTSASPDAVDFVPVVGAFAGGANGHTRVVSMVFDSAGALQSFSDTQSNVRVNNMGGTTKTQN